MTSVSVLEARFRAKYIVAASGCWEWTAGRSPQGYGAFWWNGRMRGAHHFSWVLLYGPVPTGRELDHLCRNRPCVNPAHLEPVTRAENTNRGLGPGLTSARQAAKTHCKRGHPLSGDNLIVRPTHRACRICSRAIWQRSNWKRRGVPAHAVGI